MHVAEYLDKYNHSIRQLSKLSGINRETIRRIIDGENFTIDTAYRLIQASHYHINLFDMQAYKKKLEEKHAHKN